MLPFLHFCHITNSTFSSSFNNIWQHSTLFTPIYMFTMHATFLSAYIPQSSTTYLPSNTTSLLTFTNSLTYWPTTLHTPFHSTCKPTHSTTPTIILNKFLYQKTQLCTSQIFNAHLLSFYKQPHSSNLLLLPLTFLLPTNKLISFLTYHLPNNCNFHRQNSNFHHNHYSYSATHSTDSIILHYLQQTPLT